MDNSNNQNSINQKLFPKLDFEPFIQQLTKDITIKEVENQHINLCLSGGGMGSMYSSGICGFLLQLIQEKRIKINHVYGTSAGAIAGFFFILGMNTHLLEEKYRINIGDFIYLVNNDLRKLNVKNHNYIIKSWIELIEEIIPPNFYKFCNDKLFITIHIINYFSIIQHNISKYESNEDLINTIKCSGSIPYVTIPCFFTVYKNKYYAIDGLFPCIEDDTYKTLYVNAIRYEYPLLHRIYIKEKFYERIMIESLYDIYHFYKYGETNKSLYYYNKKNKNANKSTFFKNICKGVLLQVSCGFIISHIQKMNLFPSYTFSLYCF